MRFTRLARFAAVAAAAAGLALAGGTAASAAVPHSPLNTSCPAMHPGFMGTQTAANGESLAIAPGFASTVAASRNPSFDQPFQPVYSACFDQTHPAQFAAVNGLVIRWASAASFSGPQFVEETSTGHLALVSASSAAAVGTRGEWVYDAATSQMVNGFTGRALALEPNGTATTVPAGTVSADTSLSFTPAP